MKTTTLSQAIGLTIIAAILIGVNHMLILSINASGSTHSMPLSGDLSRDAVTIAISQGTPDVYGAQMGITFDQTQEAINVMKQYDPGYGKNKIVLTGEKLQRYIDVTTRISCEFCCGAKAISFADGRPACGCAHSQAMRGLAAYILEYYPDSYTNDELLRELARWKGRYFPKQMIQKVTGQIQSGQYTPDIASLLLGIDVSVYTGQSAPAPSDITDLPDMVGGC